jgi:hypothetical protein
VEAILEAILAELAIIPVVSSVVSLAVARAQETTLAVSLVELTQD